MNKVLKLASCACVGFVFLTNAHAATIVITDQNAPPSSASTVGGGTASIVNYDGAGALKLTTANDVNDQADVVISDNFGNFGDLLTDSSLAFDYRFQKADVSGGNEFAAPALSLLLYDEGFEGDGFVTLKYEHYWNIGNAVVPTDDWIIGTIDFSGGGVWSSGGLGLENSFGGPPLFTLQNILDGTASSSALLLEDLVLDYSALFDADLVGISLSVGSYNLNQEGYVDYVAMTTSAGTTTYDFQVVPVPAAIWLFGPALACLGWMRRK